MYLTRVICCFLSNRFPLLKQIVISKAIIATLARTAMDEYLKLTAFDNNGISNCEFILLHLKTEKRRFPT